MLKMSKGFKVPGSEENPTSKSSTIINVYSDSKKSFTVQKMIKTIMQN
mgnify:CR=1 FL=1